MATGVIRLILLAAMGLGSLWMIHILAQDFNKIRQPIANAVRLLRSRRDLNAFLDNGTDKIENFEVNWTKILKFDPLKCALSLVCELTAGAETENREAANIKALIEYSVSRGAPDEIDKAHKFGAANANLFNKCHQEYPFCPYSAKVMLKLLDLHSVIFGTGS